MSIQIHKALRATLWWALVSAAGLCSGATWAQAVVEPSGQLNLSASAFKDVPEDWLSVVVRATSEAPDAVSAQNQLKTTVEAALNHLRPQIKSGQLEVFSGGFAIYARQNSSGKVVAWQGSAELTVEGRDFGRIAAATGQLPGMVVGSMQFSLSREARQKLESEVQATAVERFRQRAQELSKAFGYTSYVVRQVNISSAEGGPSPMPMQRMVSSSMSKVSDTALPLESGKARVNINVNGTVLMR